MLCCVIFQGHTFLHSWAHRFGRHLFESTIAIRVILSAILKKQNVPSVPWALSISDYLQVFSLSRPWTPGSANHSMAPKKGKAKGASAKTPKEWGVTKACHLSYIGWWAGYSVQVKGALKPATAVNVRHILCEKYTKAMEALSKLQVRSTIQRRLSDVLKLC